MKNTEKLGKMLAIIIIFIACILLIVLLGVFCDIKISLKGNKVESDILMGLIEPASDLVTTKFHYREVKPKEFPMSFIRDEWVIDSIKDEILCVFSGTIYAGIDISDVRFKINDKDKIITVTLPDPIIIANDIDVESIRFYNTTDSLLVTVSEEEKLEFLAEAKDQAREAVLKDDIFMEEVRRNAQDAIRILLTNSEQTHNYTVRFKE